MVRKLGVIGYNDGNGHPFSFSAIVNGYSNSGFELVNWPIIHNYLREKDDSDFGFGDVRVTHAWTQHPDITTNLCAACKIDNTVDAPHQMIGNVDGVLICRHDTESHAELAMPFLEAGLPVYIDKPLSLEEKELMAFLPYLENGRLMSCSGMRYAREIDELRATLPAYGDIVLIRGAVVLDWIKYGVHLVDAVLSLDINTPVSVTALRTRHESMAIRLENGGLVQIDALGAATKNFKLDIYGTQRDSSHQLFDNFTAFKRTIGNFLNMCETGTAPIAPAKVLMSMKILRAGILSREENREVMLNEFPI